MNDETTKNNRSPKSRMKVHLHRLDLDGQPFSVVALRPSEPAHFSTNLYHQTWHILSDVGGARMLGRLLWGLSYQTKPNTIFLIHGKHIEDCPFEADPSLPIILVNQHLASLDTPKLRALKKHLHRLDRPTQTIRWHTFGLDRRAETDDSWDLWDAAWRAYRQSDDTLGRHEKMEQRSGFLIYSAAPEILRFQADIVFTMEPYFYSKDSPGDTYHYLAEADGEVQIFSNYRQQVSAAKQARKQLHPNRTPLAHIDERQQHRVIRHHDKLLYQPRRRRPANAR